MATVDWQIPEPRSGLNGWLDRLIGPGATRAEQALGWGAACAAPILLVIYVTASGLQWTALQWIGALLIAFDLGGGVAVNATGAAKRWYHRAGQGFRQHMGFVALHVIHPALIVLLFRPGDWTYAVVVYGYLMLAAAVILRTPLYLQRTVAMLALVGGLLINAYGLIPTAGLEWFLPVFYVKLLAAHLPYEEPYRPETAST